MHFVMKNILNLSISEDLFLKVCLNCVPKKLLMFS